MKSSPCEIVAERVAVGDPLGEVADHAASCARCRALTALPVELGASRRDIEPGAGFSARVTAGAQRRLGQRQRRRVALASTAIAFTAAASVALVVRGPSAPQDEPMDESSTTAPAARPLPAQPIAVNQDDDARALLRFAHYEHASRASARWSHITKPLAPYRQLVAGVHP
jgi:hypothetical protein